MKKFHISDRGASPCDATVGTCPYGGETGIEDHYDSFEEAQKVFEANMDKIYGANASIQVVPREDPEIFYENFLKYANSSPEAYEELNREIDRRSQKVGEMVARVDTIERRVDPITKTQLRAFINDYRDDLAALVEAHTNSKYYEPVAKEIPGLTSIGEAVLSEKYDPQTLEWYQQRYDTVGGSDVGVLLAKDYPEEVSRHQGYLKASYGRMLKSKLTYPEQKEGAASKNFYNARRGALYRGTVWEDRIRDDFVKDNPNLTIHNTKNQYARPDRPWQQINVDGLVSDGSKGDEITGILEIKTGSNAEIWEDGVPLSYRGQVLYYLNSTGLENAHIRAVINDSEVKDFVLNKNDPVVPGKSFTMEEYIQERVTPWFEEVKKERV